MPQLDYRHAVGPRSRFADADLHHYYDGTTPERTTIPCPVCRLPADPIIGNHHGDPRCAQIGLENAAIIARLRKET